MFLKLNAVIFFQLNLKSLQSDSHVSLIHLMNANEMLIFSWFTVRNVPIHIRHTIVISCFLKLPKNVKKHRQNQPTKVEVAVFLPTALVLYFICLFSCFMWTFSLQHLQGPWGPAEQPRPPDAQRRSLETCSVLHLQPRPGRWRNDVYRACVSCLWLL